MAGMRILVANEPPAYREVIAAVTRSLRPDTEVVLASGAELDRAVTRYRPHVVVCSRLTAAVVAQAVSWALVYPDGGSASTLSIGGRRTDCADLDFDTLLWLFDETRRLAHSSYDGVPHFT